MTSTVNAIDAGQFPSFYRFASPILAATLALTLCACSHHSVRSPEVAGHIQNALRQVGLRDVSVSQDREKGVVTLSGDVAVEADKVQAQSIAETLAGSQVVSNEIEVIPPVASDATTANSPLDKEIENLLDAALIQNHLHGDVKYDVKNGVITLVGDVNSQLKRDDAGRLATDVPNVQDVVNELQVKDQVATP